MLLSGQEAKLAGPLEQLGSPLQTPHQQLPSSQHKDWHSH